jgi:hypothetical protein
MPNPARKHWGNDDLQPGDIVYVWGQQRTPYKVKRVEEHRVTLFTIWSRTRTTIQHPDDVRKAKPGEEARFNEIRKTGEDRRKSTRDEIKSRNDAAKAELEEFIAFCNSNPVTALDGELFQRLRSLGDHASAAFSNAGYRMPQRW